MDSSHPGQMQTACPVSFSLPRVGKQTGCDRFQVLGPCASLPCSGRVSSHNLTNHLPGAVAQGALQYGLRASLLSGSRRTGPQPPLRPVLPHLSARLGLICHCVPRRDKPSVGWEFPGLWTALFLNLFIYLVCEFCLWVNSNLGAFKMLLLGDSWVKGSREPSPRIPQALTQGSWAVLLTLGWNSKLRPPKRLNKPLLDGGHWHPPMPFLPG